MIEALPSAVEVVDAIARCAQVLDEPERLREEVAQLRELPGDTVSFAVALFELERARRGDPEAREGIGNVAESLLAFWQDKRGDEIATQHPALELLWADASALMVSFEVRRFDRVLTECWEARADADALAAAIENLRPDGNRRVEFARCLYHLELARLGRASSRAEFARRAGLLQEAYPDPKVAAELIGTDDGLAHLWKELVPYLDEFFEMLEEQQAKAASAKAAAEAKKLADAMPAVTPMPESTAPAPPPRADIITEPVRVEPDDQTPPPDDQTPPPERRPSASDQSGESVALHRAPVSDDTMVEIDHAAPTPPPPAPAPKPSKADDILRAHLEAPEEEHWKVSSEAITDPPAPALTRQRDSIITDQVPALVPAAPAASATTVPPDLGLDQTLPPQREMGNVSGVFDLWLTTQAESADIEVVEAEPTAPPPAAPPPPKPPDESGEIELADVIETIPAPPADLTPVPAPRRRVSGSGIIDLQQALKDSKAQAEAKVEPPPPLEPRYQPDPAALAFWRYSEQALGLLPPGDGPRLEARVLSGDGRAERKKLNGYSDEVLRRFESVPEARAFACLLRLYLAAQMKEKSLFGGVNAKRKEAFRAALQLLSPEPLAAGHAAVWFELDGKQTVEILHGALEQVSDFLQFCARSGLDPLDPTSAEQFLP